jgi:Ca-activated chloride channel family protein
MKSQYSYALMAGVFFLTIQSFAFTIFQKRLAMGEITLHGSLTSTCISTRGGITYLQIEVGTEGFPVPDRPYRPMNIALVLDRSGSMGDERKMDYAKRAAFSLIDRLSSSDYLSIVIYDDRIETLLPRQRVKNKNRIKELLQDVYPRGSTNLGGGMVEGFRQLERSANGEFINRVILLSDGLANQGITDARELNRIATTFRRKSISLTSMGVGLDYNENLMMGLAEAGGGNYYFIEHPRQLASLFEREIQGISTVIAQNTFIDLTLGRGVTVLDVIGYEWDEQRGTVRIPVGDLYTHDRRELTVELRIPEGSGSKRIASGTLRLSDNEQYRKAGFTVDIRYSSDISEIERSKNWDMQAKADLAVSSRTVEQAVKALDEGDEDKAVARINEAKEMLMSAPSAVQSEAFAPALKEQIRELDSFSKDVRDSTADKRKVKKSLQYRNYQIQKNKDE